MTKKFISVFWLKFKVTWSESFEGRVDEWYAVETGWSSSILLESLNDPPLQLFKLCRRQKSPRKKDKKDHTKIFFNFFFFVMLVSSVVRFENFIPFWPFLFSTFFSLRITQLIDASYVEQLNRADRRTKPNTWLKRSTLYRLRRLRYRGEKKKRNNAGGIYSSQSRNYDFFVFLVWFPPYVEGFVLTPTIGRHAQSTQSVAVWMTYLDKHFFYNTWKPGGLGAPPARHFMSQRKSFNTFEKVW